MDGRQSLASFRRADQFEAFQLVAKKIQAEADKFKAQGWNWVEISLEPSLWNIIDKFQRLNPKIVGLSPELEAEVEKLEAERDAIEQRCDEEEDYSQEDDLQERGEIARLDEIQDRLDRIASAGRAFTDEQKLTSGVLLGIGHDGRLVVHRGLAQRRSKG
jgi:ParB family chromosome partitioning protein